MAATQDNAVKFAYVSGEELPQQVDNDTVYFVAGSQVLYVGSQAIADFSATAIAGLDDRIEALEQGGIVVTVTGSGDYVSNATYNDSTKTLTITKANLSDNTTYSGLAADVAQNTADIATKLDATNGVATGLTVSAAPTTDLGVANKKYVDDAVAGLSGAMHFRGVSTTPITDGGTQSATIGGEVLAAEAGDVVIYNNKEFVWTGSAWNEFGDLSDQSSFALKSTQIIAGTGLTGGGTLEESRTINHQALPASGTADDVATDTTGHLYVAQGVTKDALGHVVSVDQKDIYSAVEAIADAAALKWTVIS